MEKVDKKMFKQRFFLAFAIVTVMISSCSGDRAVRENPLLAQWDTPFETPPFDKIEDRDFEPALNEAMAIHRAEIEAITESEDEPTFDNTIIAYDSSGVLLNTISRIFSLLNSANSSPQLQKTSEVIMPALSAHYDVIAFNQTLFQRVKSVHDNRSSFRLNAEQSRLLDKVYDSFVRNGALLDKQEKERVVEINSELARLSVLFGNNVLAENNAFILPLTSEDLAGLPNSVKNSAKELATSLEAKSEGVVTLQSSSWIPFLTHSKNRELREKVYRAYTQRGNNNDSFDNSEIATNMVRLRAEKAKLLGFNNYAEYVTDNQMAGNPQAVYKLLESIYSPALQRAKEELESMNELFQKDYKDEEFASWDWWYYAEKVRKKRYNIDEDDTKPFFSVKAVQRGIFMLSNRLYGITFRPISVKHYNDDCLAYEVFDFDNTHLGVLYLDLYARPSKRGGAWCGFFREQRYQDGERVAPVVSITCNFPPSSPSQPSLLSLDETTTFFHEFGHALHFLFQNSPYRTLNRVEGDFVEFPSQLFENWAFEPELLRLYAIHHRNNSVINDKLIERISKSALFNQGFATVELSAAALSDLDIHSLSLEQIGSDFDIDAFEREALYEKRGLIEQIEPRYHYTYFNHIFNGGYSSGYYFYLWAEVLDKDGYSAFVDSRDIFSRELATRLRKSVLERGGSRAGMDMYREFRGAEPSQQALLKARGLLLNE